MAAVLKKRALAEFTQTAQIYDSANVPPKKLRLVKKSTVGVGNSSLALLSCLEGCKGSADALRTLLRVSDILELESNEIPDAVKKLADHFKIEPESAVRVKILSLLCDVGHLPGADLIVIIDETINLLKNDQSHKVLAQGMNTVLKLGKLVPETCTVLHQRLVDVAKTYLSDINHAVKCKCLEIIGVHTPQGIASGQVEHIFHIISSYFDNEDARVRSEAFNTLVRLHERNFKLKPEMYDSVCAALKDDYEIVRAVVLKVVWILGNSFPEREVLVAGSDHEIRLVDDAFGKICSAVTDLSLCVRTLAAKLLGSMKKVSPKFLNQTLDKKLMSNMRRKRTAHELAWENVMSGEWASGKKWADDAPREVLDADNISLMSSGACGAFVHGLEDEYLEVRSAAVESICELSIHNPQFANLSLDFLVDMFNDEIEDVRLKAIDSLREISEHIVLRDDQLETILGALEDFSQDVREGLHSMLATCKMSTTTGLKLCIDKLLDNLKKYPHDKRSTYRCFQRIGVRHPELVLPLVPQLLNIHPFFDMAEPDVENPQYICVLILVLNAAKSSPTIIPLLEPHTLRHYTYMLDTMPNLVPILHCSETNPNLFTQIIESTQSLDFLNSITSNLSACSVISRDQVMALQKAKTHLSRLSEIDENVAGIAQFTSLYIGAQLILSEIMERGYWMNPSNLTTQQSTNLTTNINSLLEICLKLQFFFVGLKPEEQCTIKMFRLRALALNLVYIVKGNNGSALGPCNQFLTIVEEIQKDLTQIGMEPDSFTVGLFREMMGLEEPKPGLVAKILLPLIIDAKLSKIPKPNQAIRMSCAEIIDPTGQTDTSLKFTAGLIMAVRFEAEIMNLNDSSRIRLKVKYPDQTTQIILPRRAHLKPLHSDGGSDDTASNRNNFRLLTSVLISHQVWSEACTVEINIALAIPEADVGKRKAIAQANPTLLDLCKPVRVSVAPKPIKRTM